MLFQVIERADVFYWFGHKMRSTAGLRHATCGMRRDGEVDAAAIRTVDEALEASGYASLRELLEGRGDEAKSLLRKLTTITERAKPKVWELKCCGIIRESIGV